MCLLPLSTNYSRPNIHRILDPNTQEAHRRQNGQHDQNVPKRHTVMWRTKLKFPLSEMMGRVQFCLQHHTHSFTYTVTLWWLGLPTFRTAASSRISLKHRSISCLALPPCASPTLRLLPQKCFQDERKDRTSATTPLFCLLGPSSFQIEKSVNSTCRALISDFWQL